MPAVVHIPFTILLCIALLVLTGCRAMDTHDRYGDPYHNEQQRFYAPEKAARVGRSGHAYLWKSGQLEGSCDSVSGSVDSARTKTADVSQIKQSRDPLAGAGTRVVDNITLTSTALFSTDSTELSSDGRKALLQLTKRINAYRDVERVEIDGHTDDQGSHAHNQSLSEARAAVVKSFVLSNLSQALPIQVTSFGESKPAGSNRNAFGKQQNRRVEARLVAQGVRIGNSDATLCHATPLPGDIKQSQPRFDSSKSATETTQWQLDAFSGQLPVSVGDQLQIEVAGDEDMNGFYEVSIGGGINMPLLGTIPVHGLTVPAIRLAIEKGLVDNQLVHAHSVSVNTAVEQWAPIEVFVSGAVFAPGRITINFYTERNRQFKRADAPGDYARNRLLSAALQNAGGIRPDADLENIQVLRHGELIDVDLSGLLMGTPAKDLPLISGDEVVVPSISYFQHALVRPTQITPPGIRVFISNPTVPIFGNSGANIDKDSFSIPYGTRFLRGLVNANCVGGTQHTNASRRGVLISTNPVTGNTEVIERSIQQLISDPDRDDINPYLMPNDGIACYDSSVSNIRDVARTLSDILAPFVDLTIIFRDL